MDTERTSYLGVSALFVLVFAVAAAVTVAAIYTTVTIGTPAFVIAAATALLSLYGFYRSVTALVATSRTPAG